MRVCYELSGRVHIAYRLAVILMFTDPWYAWLGQFVFFLSYSKFDANLQQTYNPYIPLPSYNIRWTFVLHGFFFFCRMSNTIWK